MIVDKYYNPKKDMDQVNIDMAAVTCDGRSAVAWYPFEPGAKILQVGYMNPYAILELCKKASEITVIEGSRVKARVMNDILRDQEKVTLLLGDIVDCHKCLGQKKYDYIILPELSNRGTSYRLVSYLRNLLGEGGRMIFLGNNPANAWDYKEGACISKTRLMDMLGQLGFTGVKAFYPMPSYDLVGRVYSDKCQPSSSEWGALSNIYCGDPDELKANIAMCRDMLSQGLYSYNAPAYFIEASIDGQVCPIDKVNGLFDDRFELPMLGFDYREAGYFSVTDAVESITADTIKERFEFKRRNASLTGIDLDDDICQKVVDIELDLLKKLKQVCDQHDLKLYAMYGTMLGAVRHGGIIPGDDDIDVALMREDYDKLLELADQFQGDYFLQTPSNDDCFYGGYLKLRNRATTAINPQNWWVDCCEGIGIDIFPLDYGYANEDKEQAKLRKITHLQRLLYAKAYGYFPDFKDMKMLEWKGYKYAGKLSTRQELASQLTEAMTASDKSKKAPLGIYAHYTGEVDDAQRRFSQEDFEETITLSYSGIELLVPKNYDGVLRQLYGDNYMDQLNWQEYKLRHGFYDVNRPYTYYKDRFRGLLRPVPADKKVVLFGDQELFDSFIEQYEGKCNPVALVSLEEGSGEFQDFLAEHQDLDQIYPVICAFDMRSAIARLEAAGLANYYIYLHNRNWMLLSNYTFAYHEFEQ